MYHCKTCGLDVRGVKEARRHARQGYRTQREAFVEGQLHSLELIVAGTTTAGGAA